MTIKPYATTPKLTRQECDGLFQSPTDRIDLRALTEADIMPLIRVVQNFLMRNGYEALKKNVYIKPEDLAQRWDLSISCLNNWRLHGVGPIYMKTGPGPKASVRYPLFGKYGVLDHEQRKHFFSTEDERMQSVSNMEGRVA